MENKEDDIEDLFRERFENDEAPVSPRVWQNIKKTLPEDKDKFGFIFSQNVVLWTVIGVLLVSAVTGAYVHFSSKQVSTTNLAVTKNIAYEANKNSSPISDSLAASNLEKTHTKYATGDKSELTQPNYSKENQSNLSNESQSNKANSGTYNSSAQSTASYNKDAGTFQNKKTQTYPTSNASIANKKENYKKRKSNLSDAPDALTHSDAALRKQNPKKQSSIAYIKTSRKNKNENSPSKEVHRSEQLPKYYSSSAEKIASINRIDSTDRTFVNNSGRDEVSQKTKFASNNNESTNLSSIKTNPNQQPSDTSLYRFNPAILIPTTSDSASIKIENKTTSSEGRSNSDASTDSLNERMEDKSSYSSNIMKQTVSADSLHSYSSIENESVKTNISKDSLKKSDLAVATQHPKHSDSTGLNNDSIVKDSLDSSSNTDSSLVVLDSTQIEKKDSVIAEANTKKEKAQSKLLRKISIDLVAAALMTGASTKGTDSLKSRVAEKNNNDKNSLGYSAGVLVNYQLSHRFRVSTGIVYNTYTEQYNLNYTLKTSHWVHIDSTWQYIQVDSINRDIKAKDKYSFISIPLQVTYTFLAKEKIQLSLTAGIRTNLLLKGVTYLPNRANTDVVETRSGFNSISFSYLLSLEAAYKLGEHTSLLLQPVFMYGASSIHNKASGISQKPYGLGLTLGLRFAF